MCGSICLFSHWRDLSVAQTWPSFAFSIPGLGIPGCDILCWLSTWQDLEPPGRQISGQTLREFVDRSKWSGHVHSTLFAHHRHNPTACLILLPSWLPCLNRLNPQTVSPNRPSLPSVSSLGILSWQNNTTVYWLPWNCYELVHTNLMLRVESKDCKTPRKNNNNKTCSPENPFFQRNYLFLVLLVEFKYYLKMNIGWKVLHDAAYYWKGTFCFLLFLLLWQIAQDTETPRRKTSPCLIVSWGQSIMVRKEGQLAHEAACPL